MCGTVKQVKSQAAVSGRQMSLWWRERLVFAAVVNASLSDLSFPHVVESRLLLPQSASAERTKDWQQQSRD